VILISESVATFIVLGLGNTSRILGGVLSSGPPGGLTFLAQLIDKKIMAAKNSVPNKECLFLLNRSIHQNMFQ